MKLKIQTMKQQPEISDEEIRSYMNFQELLSRQTALNGSRGLSWKKAIGWTMAALVIGVPLIYYSLNPVSETTILNKPTNAKGENGPQKIQEIVTDTVPVNQSESEADTKEIRQLEKQQIDSEVSVEKSSIVTEKAEMSSESVYVQAAPVDGYDSLYKYFNDNLEYPATAIPDSTQGVMVISFVINKSGKPVQIEFVESLGEAFEVESTRLIENMPAWKPATMNGQPVLSKLSIPLTFRLKRVEAKED